MNLQFELGLLGGGGLRLLQARDHEDLACVLKESRSRKGPERQSTARLSRLSSEEFLLKQKMQSIYYTCNFPQMLDDARHLLLFWPGAEAWFCQRRRPLWLLCGPEMSHRLHESLHESLSVEARPAWASRAAWTLKRSLSLSMSWQSEARLGQGMHRHGLGLAEVADTV